ncbi:hypothetical protein RhiJN_15682 [Ceratobasidium sp. AG-Ba]|nr:hypothetical protein RhiJN_15682 [Ceratobasidium sp. AG-Ba]
MTLPLVLLIGLDVISYVAGLPAGGSGGSRGGSKGGSSGGSSGGSWGGSSGGSRSGGSGWTSSRNNGHRSSTTPLSKGAKIALAVVAGIIALIIIAILLHVLISRIREGRRRNSTTPEKHAPSISTRSSDDTPANMSHNPGHTQPAVNHISHPTTASEMTSAVMAGEGSRAGHGILGAVILGAIIWFLVVKLRGRWRERKSQEPLLLEKQTGASSYRASFDEHSNLSCNPGHTQPAVYPVTNPTSNAEMTSAVMAEGAGDGSRGGGAPIVWNARALAVISHGMSNVALHQGHPIPENDHKTDKTSLVMFRAKIPCFIGANQDDHSIRSSDGTALASVEDASSARERASGIASVRH